MPCSRLGLLRHALLTSACLAGGAPYARGEAAAAGTAADHKIADGGEQPAGSEQVNVFGQGSTRQLTSVSSKIIGQAAPGTNPLKVLDRLPGVYFQSADPYGAYEWSANLYIRGFAQSQLGFTLDDIPLGDQQFDNYDGLSITRAIISDNVARANVSQGAGSVAIASTSNLGGAVQLYSDDPKDRRGGHLEQTFGSNDTFRTFLRLDSGVLNRTGTKFFVSYQHTDLDKWKGSGYNLSDQVNAKLVQPVGTTGSLKLYFDWSAIRQFDYQDLSLNYLQTLGSHVDNYYPNYAAAYRAAQGIFTRNEQLTNDPLDVSYYSGTARRQDILSGLTYDTLIGDVLDWKSTIYGHGNSGYSTWATPYTPSPNGAPLSVRTQSPSIERYGALSSASLDLGRHTIEAGLWYEYVQTGQARYFSQAPLLGQGTLGDLNDHTPRDPFAQAWGYLFDTNTVQVHIQDTWRVTDTLKLNAGFRSLVTRTASNVYAQNPAFNGGNLVGSGALTASDGFLPQFSANWRFLPRHELFADISHNMRGFPVDGYGTNSSNTPWSANAAAFNRIRDTLKPETSWVYEGGYRLTTRPVTALLSVYHVDFSNRLQTISFGPIINPTTAVQNVGGVTTNGVEGSATITLLRGVSFFNSVSYNRSTFDDSLTTSAGEYHLRGKSVPNYPTLMYKTSLSVERGPYEAHIDGDYVSHRYLSYLNDASVPGYFIASLGARYTLGRDVLHLGPMRKVTFQLNAYNLFNKRYIATTGEVGNSLSGDYQSFLIGAPRQFFGTVGVDF
ncbi:TonB-dependent receptor domain-containing protein [Rhizosaccharibacter radicis]|uniref:TonB-dependent receptor n=1 Tax=Rhizosaccharibacter radicis TaxID=2782605 RepID=A0ABT1VYR7_9PROT|nr:TonB-dependent receptor [Acetobacteraceae bacterium KSS12]